MLELPPLTITCHLPEGIQRYNFPIQAYQWKPSTTDIMILPILWLIICWVMSAVYICWYLFWELASGNNKWECWLNNQPCLKWYTILPFVQWVHTVSQDLLRVLFHWSWENIGVFLKKQLFHLIFLLGWVQIMPEGLVASMAYRRIARTIQLLAGTMLRRLRSTVARKVTCLDWRAYRWLGACMSCALLLTAGCGLLAVYHYISWGMTE